MRLELVCQVGAAPRAQWAHPRPSAPDGIERPSQLNGQVMIGRGCGITNRVIFRSAPPAHAPGAGGECFRLAIARVPMRPVEQRLLLGRGESFPPGLGVDGPQVLEDE